MTYTIRPATADDGAACAAIYAPYVETAVTFEYPAPDAAEMSRRITNTMSAYPWLVCERDGKVLGYAYAHRFRERAAFDWAVEMSIYLSRELQGSGIGGALYSAVIEMLAAQGYVNAIGIVATPNHPSERLHEKCGFHRLFEMEKIAWKFGAWHNMAYYGLRLNHPDGDPGRPVPFPELDEDYVLRVCERHTAAIKEA